MKINKKLTISLSENDVKAIIADYLSKEGYNVSDNDVQLSVGTQWVGYGMDEHTEPYFRECVVEVKGE